MGMLQHLNSLETKHPVVVIGGRGHAKVVVFSLQAAGRTVQAVLDDDLSLTGTNVLGAPIAGPIACIREFRHAEAVIAIGDNRKRRQIAERLDCEWARVVHPSATVAPDVAIGPGTVVFAGAVIQPGACIGAHCIINTLASVDHDCRVSSFCHIAPGAHICGEVRIGMGAFLGVGASVVPQIQIGEWATLGAGAVAIRDIDPWSVQAGVPAQPLRARRAAEDVA